MKRFMAGLFFGDVNQVCFYTVDASNVHSAKKRIEDNEISRYCKEIREQTRVIFVEELTDERITAITGCKRELNAQAYAACLVWSEARATKYAGSDWHINRPIELELLEAAAAINTRAYRMCNAIFYPNMCQY